MAKISRPPRPTLPAFFFVALSLWGSSAISLYLGMNARENMLVYGGLSCLFVTAIALILLWRHAPQNVVLLMLIGAALGVSLGCATSLNSLKAQDKACGTWGEFVFIALSDAQEGSYGATCKALATGPDGSKMCVRVSLPENAPLLRYGDVVRAKGSIKAPSEAGKPYYWREGMVGLLRASVCEQISRDDLFGAVCYIRNASIERLLKYRDLDKGLSPALLCGYRESLDDELYQSFQISGLAHVVAVSGAHLAIVVSFVREILNRFRLRRSVNLVLQLVLLLAYLVFTGVPISALRSAFMVALALCSWKAKRRSSALSALSLCVLVFIAAEPHVALSISFALSALSTFGIVIFSPLLSFYLSKISYIPRFVCDALSLTISSMLTTLPLTAALFSRFSLITFIANVLAAPLFAPICSLGLLSLVLSCAFPTCALLSALASKALALLVSFLARIPFASIPADISVESALALSMAISALLWASWPSARRFLYACAVSAAAYLVFGMATGTALANASSITMLDVGQGDAFLLRSKGHSVLIDTGNQESKLLEALARQRVSALDAVIVSHSDDDHMGCLSSLRGVVDVERVVLDTDAMDCGCDNCANLRVQASLLVGEEGLEPLDKSDSISFGDFTLTAVWPDEYTDEGGNADSLCLYVSADVDADSTPDWTALFVGDLESDQLQTLSTQISFSSVDIYKLGHHGSKRSITKELAEDIQARIALVSVGANNRYGHPNPDVLEYLEDCGTQVYRSDVQGDVSCVLEKGRLRVKTLR